MWTDLMIDRVLDDGLLIEGLASVFGVSPGEIRIVKPSNSGGLPDGITADAPIWVERSVLQGDFPLQATVHLRPDLQSLVNDPADEQATVARLCAIWQASCLFSDDELNPYTWLVMRPNGRLERVTVDAAALDERNAFVIARVDRVVRLVPVAV